MLENPAEPFTTPKLAHSCDFMVLNAVVPQALVGSLGVIVIQIFCDEQYCCITAKVENRQNNPAASAHLNNRP